MRHLRTMFHFFLGEDVVLFTTDGNTDKEMTCGTLDGLYATVDFGTGWSYLTMFSYVDDIGNNIYIFSQTPIYLMPSNARDDLNPKDPWFVAH